MASNPDEASTGSPVPPADPAPSRPAEDATSRLAAAKSLGSRADATAKTVAAALVGPFKILLAVAVLALVAVPLILFFTNISDAAGAQGLKNVSLSPGLIPPRGGSYFGAPKDVYRCGSRKCASPLNSSASTRPPPTPRSGFCSAPPARASRWSKQFVQGRLKTGNATKPIPRFKNVSLVITSGIGLNRIVIPVPASAFEAASPSHCQSSHPSIGELDRLNQNAAFRTTQNILVLGQPRAFPQDWYDAKESVSVVAGRSQNGHRLPSALLLTSQDEDLSLRVHMDDPAIYAAGSDQFIFNIGRPGLMQAYTYCIAVLPFLLLISLLLYARVSKKRADASDVALGVAATVVAILPLRQVLVPSSLPGLTRLDIFFGLGISLLVALSIFIVIIIPPPEKADGQPPEKAGGQPSQPGHDAPAKST